jgi:hypothetical protein
MTPNGAHPTADQLAAFDAGRLHPDDAESVERHIAGCPDCCRALEQLPEDDLAALIRTATGGATLGHGGAVAADDHEAPPELVNHPRYEILGLLGSGGMGVVYKALQRNLDRVVAVKLLHRRLTDRPGFAERFAAEVKALARLNHPNVVTAYDADRAGDLHFVAMEYVEGESLDAVVRWRGPLPPDEACGYLRQAAAALQHASEHGIVHRDVKPANLLLTRGGVVKVVDFGLSRLVSDAGGAAGSAPPVLGTPEYMAPEQARHPERADARSDLYALGCTLYFLLAGRPPFAGPGVLQTLLAHQDTAPSPIREVRPDVPGAVAAVLDRLLAKDPAGRFAMPGEAADALATATGVPPDRGGRPSRLWVVLVGGAVVVAVGVLVGLSRHRPPEPVAGLPELPSAVEVAPMPRAGGPDALATAEQVAALRQETADRLVGWVRENNIWGPDHPVASDTAHRVEQNLAKNPAGFVVSLGGQVVKSGRPTLVIARPGGFHRFDLTPEQAAAAKLHDRGSVFAPLPRADESRRARPAVELSDLRIAGADGLTSEQLLAGTVAYHFLAPPRPGGHLRLTYYLPGKNSRVVLSHYPKSPLGERGELAFAFEPLDTRPLRERPVFVLFAEWVTREGSINVVESGETAALIHVRDK